jgi:hypothetical protein
VSSPKFLYTCQVCAQQFQHGPHIYDGKYIPAYGIMVCTGCYQGNWDGWAPQFEPAVTRKLKESGKPLPPRNPQGLLPRDG